MPDSSTDTAEHRLDATDRAVLNQLQRNGRITNTDLAALVGLSPSAVLRRVRALEDGGVIVGYTAVCDPARIGRGTTVFVEISLTNQSAGDFDRFEAAVARCTEVLSCHLMAGNADYLLQVSCRDVADYERIHRDQLTQLPGVAGIRSNFALRSVRLSAR